jgi:ADP-heptose:LPS heptosyltransferase
MTPEGLNLLQWAALIAEADYFLGCDSVGQHMANSIGKPSTVVIGATYPENITYPENKKFNIIDNGKEDRVYSPIRIAFDMLADRNNENLMKLSDETLDKIVKDIESALGKNNFKQFQMPMAPTQQQSSCCK